MKRTRPQHRRSDRPPIEIPEAVQRLERLGEELVADGPSGRPLTAYASVEELERLDALTGAMLARAASEAELLVAVLRSRARKES
jgi:hypothetical protein